MAPAEMNKNKSTLTMIIYVLIIILSVFHIHVISATKTRGIDANNNNDNNLHFNTSSLSFSNVPKFTRKILNVSLINPTNNAIIIDRYYVNVSQFTVSPIIGNYNDNKQFRLSSNSSISLQIYFSPISMGKYWAHLSVHTDNGVLYLYLYGVGIQNKYKIEPIYLNTSKYQLISDHTSYTLPKISISITNPFNNKSLIIDDITMVGPMSLGRGLVLSDIQYDRVCIISHLYIILAQKRILNNT